jgi:hypothetical protein
VSWDQQFDDPIVLPNRKPLVTLRDAALYITKLPKAEHATLANGKPRWKPLIPRDQARYRSRRDAAISVIHVTVRVELCIECLDLAFERLDLVP